MAIQHEILKAERALLLRLTGGLDAESLSDLDRFLKAAAHDAEDLMIVGLRGVRPLVATSLGRILACSKQLGRRGCKMVLVLPVWFGERAAQVERTIQQQGVQVVRSEMEAFHLNGVAVDEAFLRPRGDVVDADGADEGGDEESAGHLAELQDGLAFWLNAVTGKSGEADGLDEEDLDQVAGGVAENGSKSKFLGELKQGIKYWMGNR